MGTVKNVDIDMNVIYDINNRNTAFKTTLNYIVAYRLVAKR
jgi:hypothetical protein